MLVFLLALHGLRGVWRVLQGACRLEHFGRGVSEAAFCQLPVSGCSLFELFHTSIQYGSFRKLGYLVLGSL